MMVGVEIVVHKSQDAQQWQKTLEHLKKGRTLNIEKAKKCLETGENEKSLEKGEN